MDILIINVLPMVLKISVSVTSNKLWRFR